MYFPILIPWIVTSPLLRDISWSFSGLQVLALEKHLFFFPYCPVLQHCIHRLSDTLYFSSCLFKAPTPKYPVSSDWSAHTCLSQHSHQQQQQQLSSCANPILARWTGCTLINKATVWHGDVVWCHKITELKAGLLTRRFRSRDLCGRKELLFVQTFISTSQRCLVSSLCNLPDTLINNVSFTYYFPQNVFAVADKLYLYHF